MAKTEAIEKEEVAYEPAPLLTHEEIHNQIKPPSQNSFLAFWQNVGRSWLKVWYAWQDKQPRLTKIAYMLFFFVIFSQAVTVFQFLIFNFGVAALSGTELAGNNWGFPLVLMGQHYVTGENVYFRILGAAPRFDDYGALISGVGAGGLAFFIMFMLGTFLAQVINFPLQRNITFRSKGNLAWQIMWYFIGWILIQPLTMALGSAWEGLVAIRLGAWPGFIITLLNTIIMGGVSMAIFFVIFLIIFPNRDKVEAKAKKKLEAAKESGDSAKIAKAEAAYEDAAVRARFARADKASAKAKAQASGRALSYFASEKNFKKAEANLEVAQKEGGANLEKAQAKYDKAKDLVPIKHQAVSDAKVAKEETAAEFIEAKNALEEYEAAKATA
ncbi:MAG: hypothetical protein FWE13_03190 [Firmicutes bacterium]|nr:hypothetical protein [Bacillota bacterium]